MVVILGSGLTAIESVAVTDVSAAEVAVTVLDDHQRRGVGTLLTRALAEVAAGNLGMLSRPLADALGWRGRVFDAIGATAVQARERAFRIQTAEPLGSEMFAGDGFHPSPTLHAAFAERFEQRPAPGIVGRLKFTRLGLTHA